MDKYDQYAAGLLRLARCERGRVDAEAIALRLGMVVEVAGVDAYAGLVEAGLVVRHGVAVLWTIAGLSAAKRRRLQARVVAHWYLLREGLRPGTATRMAGPLGQQLLEAIRTRQIGQRATRGRKMGPKSRRSTLQAEARQRDEAEQFPPSGYYVRHMHTPDSERYTT